MFWLLAFSIVVASCNSVMLHRAQLDGRGALYQYNWICAAVWCLLLFLWNRGQLHLDGTVCLFGLLYGVTQALFILFKTAAMHAGPVSVTTLVGNCSILLSILACLLLWQEPATWGDAAGLILFFIGIFLSTYCHSGQGHTRAWKIYVILFFLCAAGVGLTFKAFAKSGGSDRAGDMMLVSALVMLFCYTGLCLFTARRTRGESKPPRGRDLRSFLIYALISGVLSCLYNRVNLYLSGAMDGVIFFPAFNGGVVFLSALLGILLLREKMTLRQGIGIGVGILGICMIGIF